jgi:hypothetical protein
MSESSTDKTKRLLIKKMTELAPAYSTALFLTDYLDRSAILDIYSKIRTPIARQHKQTTIIFYLRSCNARKSYIDNTPEFSSSGGFVRLPQIQLFSCDELDNEWIEEYAFNKFNTKLNVRRQKFNLVSWVKSVQKQKALNLAGILGTDNFRRYNVVNKKAGDLVKQKQDIF